MTYINRCPEHTTAPHHKVVQCRECCVLNGTRTSTYTVALPAPKPPSGAHALWSRVDGADACWFLDSHPITNYPIIRGAAAFRTMYEMDKGPLRPEGVPHHLCMNKQCIRPHHVVATGSHGTYHHRPDMLALSNVKEDRFCKVCHGDVDQAKRVMMDGPRWCIDAGDDCKKVERVKRVMLEHIMDAIARGKMSLDWLDILIFILQQIRIDLARALKAKRTAP